MSSFVTIVKNNEPVLARIPVQTRSKILSLLLTLVVQELAALASVLDDSSRAILVQTVREVGVITRRLGMTITRRTGGICSRRLQLYLASVLQRLEVSGPQGSRLPLGERLQKLHDLLRLQEVMVVNLSAVFNNLTRGFSSGNDPDDEALLETKNKLGDLLHIRKEHIFMDALLSRWLLESENRSRRFAVASPAHLLHLRRRERPTVEEMLQELLTLSVAGREQSTITEHFPQLEEAEAHIPESSELPPAGEDLLATEVPTVLLGDPLGSGEVVQWPAVDTRFLATGYSPQEPLQEGVLGSAAGEPLPRAATQQESAEEAISNPFNFPDIFEHLRRGLASPPE
ncbi:hypothetical protein, conserved [Eimeria praecox]|uniref:Uncharacterized protein n=1 Tax=Eimeria praecox TaxID=51316 RepID=U6G5J0_9EIME|nr:hypothetical protein, conserved [Eimeria praecox]